MTEIVLETEDVSVAYGGINALREASVRIERGEAVALLGPNGAGKSTLLRAVSGLVRPHRGRILFCGDDITRTRAASIARAGVSHVPEGSQVFGTLTVEENLRSGTFAAGGRAGDISADDVFELFPILGQRRTQRAGSLSGGEQQMLALARALLGAPVLMLLDEPSLGLAPLVIEAVFERIHELRARGMTMVIAEQNAALALDVVDRVYVLRQGRVVDASDASKYRNNADLLHSFV